MRTEVILAPSYTPRTAPRPRQAKPHGMVNLPWYLPMVPSSRVCARVSYRHAAFHRLAGWKADEEGVELSAQSDSTQHSIRNVRVCELLESLHTQHLPNPNPLRGSNVVSRISMVGMDMGSPPVLSLSFLPRPVGNCRQGRSFLGSSTIVAPSFRVDVLGAILAWHAVPSAPVPTPTDA